MQVVLTAAYLVAVVLCARAPLAAQSVAGGLSVLQEAFHSFEGQGATGMLLLSSSHLTVHTWPEFGYAAVDLFTCATPASAPSSSSSREPDVDAAIRSLVESLHATKSSVRHVKRGLGQL